MVDPKDVTEVTFKAPVDKEVVDARYLEKARKLINKPAMYSRMFLSSYRAWLRAMMKSEK